MKPITRYMKVAELRKTGLTFYEIGLQLGISRQRAHTLYLRSNGDKDKIPWYARISRDGNETISHKTKKKRCLDCLRKPNGGMTRCKKHAREKSLKVAKHRYKDLEIPKQYWKKIKKKMGVCPICRRKKRLCIDHCHKSNRFRGVICIGCNGHLGWLELYGGRAMSYLKEFDEKKNP